MFDKILNILFKNKNNKHNLFYLKKSRGIILIKIYLENISI